MFYPFSFAFLYFFLSLSQDTIHQYFQSIKVERKKTGLLECFISDPRARVKWYKGEEPLEVSNITVVECLFLVEFSMSIESPMIFNLSMFMFSLHVEDIVYILVVHYNKCGNKFTVCVFAVFAVMCF